MKIGDVYYEKHTVTKISHRTNTVLETDVEIVNMLPIDVLDKIRAEIEETIESYVCDKEENTMKAQGMLNAMQMTFDIIDKYR